MAAVLLWGADGVLRDAAARTLCPPPVTRLHAGEVSAGQLAAAVSQPGLFAPPAPVVLEAAQDAAPELLDAAAAADPVLLVADVFSARLRAAARRHAWEVRGFDLPGSPAKGAERARARAADAFPGVPADTAGRVGWRCADDVWAAESALRALQLCPGSADDVVDELCSVAVSAAPPRLTGDAAVRALLAGKVQPAGWLAAAASGDARMAGWLAASRSGVAVEVAAVCAAAGLSR